MLAFLASDCQGDVGAGVGVPCGDVASQSLLAPRRRRGEAAAVPARRKAYLTAPERRQLSTLTVRRRDKRGAWALTRRRGGHGRLTDRSPGVLTQARDDRRQHMQNGVHLCQRIAGAETKPDRPLKPLVSKPHGDEHVRRLEAPRATGGPGGGGDPFSVQSHYQGLAVYPFETHTGRGRQTWGRRAIHPHVGDGGQNPLLQTVAQRRDPRHLIRHMCGGPLGRHPEPDDGRDMLRSTPQATLLWASGDDGVEYGPPTHIQRPNPFWAMDLMARERQEIDAEGID